MSDTQKKFYLTTPIYYVNARPHIGHAYTTIVADVLARRHRLLGEDTFFLTGTDEHGQKIERSAAAAGIPPQQFANRVSGEFRALWNRMGLLEDTDDPLFHRDFIRTTDQKHIEGVQKLFNELFEQGFIYLDTYTGAYCVSDEAFVDVAAGEPCPDCGRITEVITEENFFFRLSAFQRTLLDLIESRTLIIENDARRNEVLSFLRGPIAALEKDGFVYVPSNPGIKQSAETEPYLSELMKVTAPRYTANGTSYVPGALRDLSISRTGFKWGIDVTGEAAKLGHRKHVIYVWLDALANYMTAVGYGSENPVDKAKLKRFWPADLHLVGKEIIRFHCVYWPAFLLALNPALKQPKIQPRQDKDSLVLSPDPATVDFSIHKAWAKKMLPKAIVAHGWLLFDNSKMSKSKGNIVRTETILDAFGDHVYGKQFPDSSKAERDLFASDVLRYFLLREIPFGQDGSFSFDALITRYNADLANGYGNLVSRTLSMIEKYNDSCIPPSVYGLVGVTDFISYIDRIDGTTEGASFFQDKINRALNSTDFYSLLELAQHFIKRVDQFLSDKKPWKLNVEIPEEQNERNNILYTAADALKNITFLLHPFMPSATASAWKQLGFKTPIGSDPQVPDIVDLRNMRLGGLKPGTKLGALAPIFPRADKSLVEIMMNMENPETKTTAESGEQAGSRPDAPLKSADTPTPAQPVTEDRLHPAAPPRSFSEAGSASHVGGSAAISTHNGPTPSHTEATPSAPFSNAASQTPITAGPADASPQITIDDFAKVELRVAQILVAERIPKADKLLRLEVDLGYEKRQILSGIAEHYAPEDLVGRRIVVITNLAPRKMRGLESHGMLLAASDGEGGKPVLATMSEETPLGLRLK